MNLPYSMLIQWSNPDRSFLVLFPELTGETPQTHGGTYEEAARNGQEALEGLIGAFRARKIPLPDPSVCHFAEEAVTSKLDPASL